MRELTDKQHRSLDRIADGSPSTKVVAWDSKAEGPVVLNSQGHYKSVARTGYPRDISWPHVEADFSRLEIPPSVKA